MAKKLPASSNDLTPVSTILDDMDDNKTLFDLIDNLRKRGVNYELELPRIVVCGDQSSGKSSVLEAISNVKFPQKDTLCTRFPIELILRKNNIKSWSVSIEPGSPPQEVKDVLMYNAFPQAMQKLVEDPRKELFTIVKEAEKVTGVGQEGKAFVRDTLCLRIEGPDMLDLDLVDLPGIYHAGADGQRAEDAPMVRALVESYMQKKMSIILAVVSARAEVAGQTVTTLAQFHDPNGERTLGIITKPDRTDGDGQDQQFLKLALNKTFHFNLGWHVLRNRAHNEGEIDKEERDRIEAEYLDTKVWASIPSQDKGIHSLGPKLTKTYRLQILKSLPAVIQKASEMLQAQKTTLDKIQSRRGNLMDRDSIVELGRKIIQVVNESMTGSYTDPIFAKVNRHGQIRKQMEEQVNQFRNHLRDHGHTVNIVDELPRGRKVDGRFVTYDRFAERLMTTISVSDIPGQFNPILATRLFYDQAASWPRALEKFAVDVVDRLSECVMAITSAVAGDAAADVIRLVLIGPMMEELKKNMMAEAKEKLPSFDDTEVIGFTSEIRNRAILKAQARDMALTTIKAQQLSGKDGSNGDNVWSTTAMWDMTELRKHFEPQIDPSRTTVYKAIECMLLHYEVELERVTSSIQLFEVDRLVLRPFKRMFTADSFRKLNATDIDMMLGETEEDRLQRQSLEESVGDLRFAITELQIIQLSAYPDSRGQKRSQSQRSPKAPHTPSSLPTLPQTPTTNGTPTKAKRAKK